MPLTSEQKELQRLRISAAVKTLNAALSDAYLFGLRGRIELVGQEEHPTIEVKLMNPMDLFLAQPEPAKPYIVPEHAAAALAVFGDEHGLPNAISPKELHEQFSGPYPFDFGWHYRYNRAAIDAACLARGIRIVSFGKPDGNDLKQIEIETAQEQQTNG